MLLALEILMYLILAVTPTPEAPNTTLWLAVVANIPLTLGAIALIIKNYGELKRELKVNTEKTQDIATKQETLTTQAKVIVQQQGAIVADQANLKDQHAHVVTRQDQIYALANGNYTALETRLDTTQRELAAMHRLFDAVIEVKNKDKVALAIKDREKLEAQLTKVMHENEELQQQQSQKPEGD